MSLTHEDLSTILANEGIGVEGASSGWGLFIDKEPDSPDSAITLYHVGGQPNPKFLLDENMLVQVRVRGDKSDTPGALSKIEEIQKKIVGRPPEVINGNQYVGFWVSTGVLSLGEDDNNRPRYVINFRITREPSVDSPVDHRTPL